MTPRPPLSRRHSKDSVEDFFVLREGIPDGLLNSLLEIFVDYFTIRNRYGSGRSLNLERTEHLARLIGRDLPQSFEQLFQFMANDPKLLLDAVDHALQYPNQHTQQHLEILEKAIVFLDEARSVYTVMPLEGSSCQLALRQPPELTVLVEQVTSDTSRASEHLRRAWTHAFARDPDASSACFEAAKAVEAAARSTIEPKNSKATLGTMLRAIESKPEKWATEIETPDARSLETVISMMRMIWKGHLRHGNPDDPLDVSTEQCEMIVHTAALLVHWFTAGRIRAI